MTKVLVVDDEMNQGRALAIGLRLEGFEVTAALDANEALASLALESFHVALLDLMLPGTNGISLARAIHAQFPETCIVLTSAYHLTERQLLQANCGASGFVPKPYALPELAAFLRAKVARNDERVPAKSGSHPKCSPELLLQNGTK